VEVSWFILGWGVLDVFLLFIIIQDFPRVGEMLFWFPQVLGSGVALPFDEILVAC